MDDCNPRLKVTLRSLPRLEMLLLADAQSLDCKKLNNKKLDYISGYGKEPKKVRFPGVKKFVKLKNVKEGDEVACTDGKYVWKRWEGGFGKFKVKAS